MKKKSLVVLGVAALLVSGVAQASASGNCSQRGRGGYTCSSAPKTTPKPAPKPAPKMPNAFNPGPVVISSN